MDVLGGGGLPAKWRREVTGEEMSAVGAHPHSWTSQGAPLTWQSGISISVPERFYSPEPQRVTLPVRPESGGKGVPRSSPSTYKSVYKYPGSPAWPLRHGLRTSS